MHSDHQMAFFTHKVPLNDNLDGWNTGFGGTDALFWTNPNGTLTVYRWKMIHQISWKKSSEDFSSFPWAIFRNPKFDQPTLSCCWPWRFTRCENWPTHTLQQVLDRQPILWNSPQKPSFSRTRLRGVEDDGDGINVCIIIYYDILPSGNLT